jgi:hypothetical protein
MVCRIPGGLAVNSCQVREKLLRRSANAADDVSQSNPSLRIFRRPNRVGGLESDRHSCLLTSISSVNADLLSSSVGFRSVDSVRSLDSLL